MDMGAHCLPKQLCCASLTPSSPGCPSLTYPSWLVLPSCLPQEKLYSLDLGKIRLGEDKRTTLMVKNIPNKYTQKMLLAVSGQAGDDW